MAAPVLIKREVVADQAYTVSDVDDPTGTALVVALAEPTGWKVATATRVLAERLDRRQAIALMMRSAKALASGPTVNVLTA
ncbi:hypothetical protein [Micromonospora sp. NPDC005652]|uniref:hypothetical protein n=1 Tax=Micromonospora sp. NPDC005652 TaxID=3157046 RepID=UPI0033D031D5